MKEITHDADIDINKKEALIYNTGLEAKDLLEVIDEYKSAKDIYAMIKVGQKQLCQIQANLVYIGERLML